MQISQKHSESENISASQSAPLNGLESGTYKSGGSLELRYINKLESSRNLINVLSANSSLRAIADANKLAALESFLPDLDIWQLLIDHGDYLDLDISKGVYANKVRTNGYAVVDDRNLKVTLPNLLALVLDPLPFFKNGISFKVDEENLENLTTTLATLEKLL